jgi:hypothetical protein
VSTSRFVVPIAVLLVLIGCGERRSDPDAVAVAKCYLPLVQKVKPSSEQGVDRSNIEVRDLGHGGREVTGSFSVSPGGSPSSFVCVVTPDASDKLRGLRVERLDIQ